MKINELVTGTNQAFLAIVKEFSFGRTNNGQGSEYMDLTLADSSGDISGKIWDVGYHQKAQVTQFGLVRAEGPISLYKEKKQIKITSIEKVVIDDSVNILDYVKTAPIASDSLVKYIHGVANLITDDVLKAITWYCIEKVGDALGQAPAAQKMHHAYFGGLAYHMSRMLQIGNWIIESRPIINGSLLRAGIILHDIAKPVEMIHSMGMVADYSFEGKLIGHINLIYGWILEACYKLGIDPADKRVSLLQHLVLSHHNTGEWGSPVQPQTIEAVALHYIDQLDAKLQMAEDAILSSDPETQWTPKVFSLENKPLYKHGVAEFPTDNATSST